MSRHSGLVVRNIGGCARSSPYRGGPPRGGHAHASLRPPEAHAAWGHAGSGVCAAAHAGLQPGRGRGGLHRSHPCELSLGQDGIPYVISGEGHHTRRPSTIWPGSRCVGRTCTSNSDLSIRRRSPDRSGISALRSANTAGRAIYIRLLSSAESQAEDSQWSGKVKRCASFAAVHRLEIIPGDAADNAFQAGPLARSGAQSPYGSCGRCRWACGRCTRECRRKAGREESDVARQVPGSGSGTRRERGRCGAEGQHYRAPAMGRGRELVKKEKAKAPEFLGLLCERERMA